MSSAISAWGVQNQAVSPLASTVRRSSQPASESLLRFRFRPVLDGLALALAAIQAHHSRDGVGPASASASFCFRIVTVARLHDRCSG